MEPLTTKDKVRQINAAGRADPDVKLMINAVQLRKGASIIRLAEDQPKVIDDLYEAISLMVDDIEGIEDVTA